MTQPRGSFFCCTTTSRVKTSAAPEITLEVVTWNRVPESAAHFRFWAPLFSPKTCLDLKCTDRHQACNQALFSIKLKYVDLDLILFLEVVLLITNFPYFTGLDHFATGFS